MESGGEAGDRRRRQKPPKIPILELNEEHHKKMGNDQGETWGGIQVKAICPPYHNILLAMERSYGDYGHKGRLAYLHLLTIM